MKTRAIIRARLGWALIDAQIFAFYSKMRIWSTNKKMARLNKRISRLEAELVKPTIVVGPDGVDLHNMNRMKEE